MFFSLSVKCPLFLPFFCCSQMRYVVMLSLMMMMTL